MKDAGKRKTLSTKEHVEGVLAGNRMALSLTITLMESSAKIHGGKALKVLERLSPHSGNSIRIGITGAPGVGKSTFIDALGSMLTKRGRKVAVLAIDPSSSITGGSILGDKTRMESLANDPNAFIRPSPAGATLGGVAKKTREAMIVCEAAGFDVVIIETVGVGQSEVEVRSMVDFFLLLTIAGAGDELQGIKRGVMELADLLLVNKADGDNKKPAESACAEYARALHYMLPATKGWATQCLTCSAKTGEGVEETWRIVEDFTKLTKESLVFKTRREFQSSKWLHNMISDRLLRDFYENPKIKKELKALEIAVKNGQIPAALALQRLFSNLEE